MAAPEPSATSVPQQLSRRAFLMATGATVAAAAAAPALAWADAAPRTESPEALGADREGAALFRQLDAKIRAGMAKYAVPGAAVGVLYRGREYVRGYGVANVDYPQPVDADTVFRIGSTTKTFTGTVIMRLVERGKLALDARVRRYLPDFATADPSAARLVTVRQLLNHSAGWLGDVDTDTGPGDDALARYVTQLSKVPQLTPPGKVLAYNNAALVVAGRLIELATGKPYEAAVRELLADPLRLTHTRFFPHEVVGLNVAASHKVVDGKPVAEPEFYFWPRSLSPAGGLISSVRDQLRYARFHLGDGTTPQGRRLLSRRSVLAMRSNPGPGGTLLVELEGMGVTWRLRPTAQGIRIVEHGGDLPGQHSGFVMVPERAFALTLLTNSEGGPNLVNELFVDDWALRRFAGVANLPAVPRRLSPRELAAYEGRYIEGVIDTSGRPDPIEMDLTGDNGQLRMVRRESGQSGTLRLAFYRKDHVLVTDENGERTLARADFLRSTDGRVQWLRLGGRLSRRQVTGQVMGKVSADASPLVQRPWRLRGPL